MRTPSNAAKNHRIPPSRVLSLHIPHASPLHPHYVLDTAAALSKDTDFIGAAASLPS